MEARYYDKLDDNRVHCHLCPHECTIAVGRTGTCKVRSNEGGTLLADNYGNLSAVNFDPIEKKPLYHFHPGTEILSLGALGCNFKCRCCQNYHISQSGKKEFPRTLKMSINDIITMAKSNPNNIGIAYTYNEPTVWYEYMFDIAGEAQKAGLRNVVVSNGYINAAPIGELIKLIDAFNIDLKAFSDDVYKNFTGGGVSKVLDTLTLIAESKKHLEITFLAVPGINDDINLFVQMIDWIERNLSPQVPLHISRYFPRYKMTTDATPQSILMNMAKLANDRLNYVYVGNIPADEFQNTVCPNCGQIVIERRGYYIHSKSYNASGQCSFCGFNILEV
jgi:pyruvate formate lyase activating enzyme